MKPVFQKPNRSSRRGKTPGRQVEHPGSRRPVPERIDRQVEHRAEVCPQCGGPLCQCAETRTRYIEDIPVIQPVVTEHVIHRDWCPKCAKKVEPVVAEALPGSTLGSASLRASTH